MDRRDILRLLATGGLLQLAPRRLLAVAREVRAFVQAQATPRTLSPHQHDTVKAIADLIIPRTDTPGAADVGVAGFIDLMLTDWYEEAERTRFLSGLGDVDTRGRALGGKDFVECSSRQQSDVLLALGKEMAEQDKKNIRHSRGRRAPAPENFYAMFRHLTLTAYYTSEAGATRELHFEMVPDRYQGCPAAPAKETPERR